MVRYLRGWRLGSHLEWGITDDSERSRCIQILYINVKVCTLGRIFHNLHVVHSCVFQLFNAEIGGRGGGLNPRPLAYEARMLTITPVKTYNTRQL